MLGQCAACGKESEDLKTCSGCNSMKYCNVDCQKAHRKQHKANCKTRSAEFEVALFEIGIRAAELFDEILFKKPPPREDCPICMIQLPSLENESVYQTCCGKTLCSGCAFEMIFRQIKANGKESDHYCPFCRNPAKSNTSEEENIRKYMKRMEVGDAEGFLKMGLYYMLGKGGLKQDMNKAVELFSQGAELGSEAAHCNLSIIFHDGIGGVELDETKSMYYLQQAAIGGCLDCLLGCYEANAGNMDRAVKHLIIAAGTGHKESLNTIRLGFMNGDFTKDEYEKSLREYQAYINEIKSEARDKAAAMLLAQDKTKGKRREMFV